MKLPGPTRLERTRLAAQRGTLGLQRAEEEGHDVTVVIRNVDRRAAIEYFWARAALGNLEDTTFLSDVLKGADALFLLITPGGTLTDDSLDIDARFHNIGESCTEAIRASGVTLGRWPSPS